MDFNLKTYKHLKIKHYFKTVNFFFFFYGTSLKNKNWTKIEQKLVSHELRYFRIFNKLLVNTLKNSIFKNVVTLIHGPIIILNSKNSTLTFKEMETVNSLIGLLGFRLNNKIYSKEQIQNFKKMSYLENFHIFHNSMKTFTKMPYYKLKIKKIESISK